VLKSGTSNFNKIRRRIPVESVEEGGERIKLTSFNFVPSDRKTQEK
jgi:hypothetical protein